MHGLGTKSKELFVNSLIDQYDSIFVKHGLYDAELFHSNVFDVFRADRNFKEVHKDRGGGVFMAIKRQLNSCLYDITLFCPAVNEIPSIDIVAVRIKISNNFAYIITLYIPPNTLCETYEHLFDCVVSSYDLYGSHIIILDDFNLPKFVLSFCGNLFTVEYFALLSRYYPLILIIVLYTGLHYH